MNLGALARWMRFLGLVLLGWGAWLSFPGTASRAEELPGLTAMVLDVSASATRLRTGWEVRARRSVLAAVTDAAEREDDFLLVTYGADVRRVFGPAPAEEALDSLRGSGSLSGEGIRLALEPARTLESRITSALEVVRGPILEPNRISRRLLLRVDESFTGVDPASTLAGFVAQGVALERLALEAADQADLALQSIEVPPQIELGTRAMARLKLVAQGFDSAKHSAKVELEIEHDGHVSRSSLSLPLPNEGASSTTHFIDLGIVEAGTTTVRAHLRLIEASSGYVGDRIPENDRGATQFRSSEALTCLVVTHDVERARQWLGRVPEGIEVRYCFPEELGAQLARADLCVSCDVSPSDLDGALLSSFMLRGGGWLASGGWELLRGWDGMEAGKAAELLPLKPAEGQRPPRDVQFVVDGSGSMGGKPFQAVRAALIDLVPAAPLEDRVSLRFFTGALQPRLVLSSQDSGSGLTREQRVREVLSDTVPGGQTLLVSSLEQLAKERASATDEALILLLSDGRESNGFKSLERAADLAVRFAATRTRLEVIAVGTDPDLGLLRAFLSPGGELTRVFDFEGLDEVFQRSVNRERVESGPLSLVVSDAALEGLGQGTREALNQTSLPVLARALLMEERSGSSVLLRSQKGNPVLGLRRVGQGTCALLATGPGDDWSGALRLGEHLESLLRRLGRDTRPERAPRITLNDQLVLENADVDWPGLLTARFSMRTARGEVWLGDSQLGLDGRPASVDPRSVRVASRPTFLDGLVPGTPLVVDLLDEREVSFARLACGVPNLAEFVGRRRLAWLPEPVTDSSLADLGLVRASHAWAPLLLGLGVLLLTLAGLALSGLLVQIPDSDSER